MQAVAKLRKYQSSPRKMRLLVNEIRGLSVQKALDLLTFHPMAVATPLKKLLLSAVNNWRQVNNSDEVDGLKVKTIFVDESITMKRLLPAPQGRGYRVRKRSCHVTIIVDEMIVSEQIAEEIVNQEA